MHRLALLILAALALAIGAWFLVRPEETSGRRPSTGSEPRARADADLAAEPGPVLVGRAPGSRVPRATTVPGDASPTEDLAPEPATDLAEDTSPIGMLIQRIQREVEPAAWKPPGEAKMKHQGGRNLVVRAARPVQEGITEFLDGLRDDDAREALREAGVPPAPESADAEARAAGEEDLRRLLRGMLDQWKRLEGALRARSDSRIADALRLIDEVLVNEPDHAAAVEYRKLLLDPPPSSTLVDLDVGHGGLEPLRGPYVAIERRIEGLAPGRIPYWALVWPSPTTFKALDRARTRAGMERWTFTGAERERRLQLRAPIVRLEGLTLSEALQRLAVEALIDLGTDWDVWPRDATLPRPAPADATLGALLHAIAAAVGPNVRVRSYRTVIELTPEGQVPHLEVRVFNVDDLLAPQAEHPELEAVGGTR